MPIIGIELDRRIYKSRIPGHLCSPADTPRTRRFMLLHSCMSGTMSLLRSIQLFAPSAVITTRR